MRFAIPAFSFRRFRHAASLATLLVATAAWGQPAWAEPDDPDGDGIDAASDNCPRHANPGQRDTDGDGVGNFCDHDLDNDGDVDRDDYKIAADAFGAEQGDERYNAHADHDGDGVVGPPDLSVIAVAVRGQDDNTAPKALSVRAFYGFDAPPEKDGAEEKGDAEAAP